MKYYLFKSQYRKSQLIIYLCSIIIVLFILITLSLIYMLSLIGMDVYIAIVVLCIIVLAILTYASKRVLLMQSFVIINEEKIEFKCLINKYNKTFLIKDVVEFWLYDYHFSYGYHAVIMPMIRIHVINERHPLIEAPQDRKLLLDLQNDSIIIAPQDIKIIDILTDSKNISNL